MIHLANVLDVEKCTIFHIPLTGSGLNVRIAERCIRKELFVMKAIKNLICNNNCVMEGKGMNLETRKKPLILRNEECTMRLPGGGFHGGEQEETLPGGGFH